MLLKGSFSYILVLNLGNWVLGHGILLTLDYVFPAVHLWSSCAVTCGCFDMLYVTTLTFLKANPVYTYMMYMLVGEQIQQVSWNTVFWPSKKASEDTCWKRVPTSKRPTGMHGFQMFKAQSGTSEEVRERWRNKDTYWKKVSTTPANHTKKLRIKLPWGMNMAAEQKTNRYIDRYLYIYIHMYDMYV